MANTKALTLRQGKSQPFVLRCETVPIVYKTISAVQLTAPLRLTVTGHGLVDGWRAAITGVKGVDTVANDIKDGDYYDMTVVDANTVEVNAINATAFKTYTSGGVLQYNTPMDLSGFEARLQVRNKKGGDTLLYEMTTANKLIGIDTALNTVTLFFDAVPLATQTWKKGYYELELFKTVTRDGESVEIVYSPLEGSMALDMETAK